MPPLLIQVGSPELILDDSIRFAAKAKSALWKVKNQLTVEKVFPQEKKIGEEPRIGIFVCRCGVNIGGVVNVPEVVKHAQLLEKVVYCEEDLHTCSIESQELIKKAVQAASCGPVNIDLKDVQHATTPLTFVDSHSVRGGPSPAEVKRMLKIRKKWIEASKAKGLKKKSELDLAEEKLQTTVKRLSGPR